MSETLSKTAMMWNEKYKADEYYYGTKPNDFLRLAVKALRPGARVLSVGEGEGRNAVYLAQQGFKVTAVDASSVGRDKARHLAKVAGVELDYLVKDLGDGFESLGGEWDAIVSIWCHLPNELRQQFYKWTPGALRRGGFFIFEGYTPKQLEFGTGGPKDIALLCEPSDIRRELLASEVSVEFEILQAVQREVKEGIGHSGPSATLQILMHRSSED